MSKVSGLPKLLLVASAALLMLLFALACASDEPEAPPTPTPIDVEGIVGRALGGVQPGVTSEEMASAIQQALAAQPGVTTQDVANEIAKALAAQPGGVTSAEMASAIASALEQQEGLTTEDVASEIAKALQAQQPGVTPDELSAAIQGALAERPGVTEAQVAAAIESALAGQRAEIEAAVQSAVAASIEAGSRGGTLRASVPYDVFHFDPHRNGATPALIFFSNVFEHLAAVDPNNRDAVIGQIATKWEQSGDGTEWTYTIREGIDWHDGEALGADDVVSTFQRILDRPNNMPIGRLKCINALVDSVEQIDDNTVKVTLEKPAVNYYACWTQPFFHILPQHVTDTIDTAAELTDLTQDDWIGNGAFKVSEWRRNDVTKLEANDNYYIEGLPLLDGIEVYVIPDNATRLSALEAGRIEIHSGFPAISKQEATDLKNARPADLKVHGYVPPGALFWFMNVNAETTNEHKIREAMHLAINRQQLIEIVGQGSGQPSHPYWSDTWMLSMEDWLTYPGIRPDKTEDLARAKQLVEEATGGAGADAAIMVQSGVFPAPQLAEVISTQLRDININAEVRALDPGAGITAFVNQDFVTTVWETNTGYADPDSFIDQVYLSPNVHWQDEDLKSQYIALWEQERGELDRAKRGALLRQMVDIQLQDLNTSWAIRPDIQLVYSASLQNFVPWNTIMHHSNFSYVWLEQ